MAERILDCLLFDHNVPGPNRCPTLLLYGAVALSLDAACHLVQIAATLLSTGSHSTLAVTCCAECLEVCHMYN